MTLMSIDAMVSACLFRLRPDEVVFCAEHNPWGIARCTVFVYAPAVEEFGAHGQRAERIPYQVARHVVALVKSGTRLKGGVLYLEKAVYRVRAQAWNPEMLESPIKAKARLLA